MLHVVKEWFVIWDPGKLTKDSIAQFVQVVTFSWWWLSFWWNYSEQPANRVFDGTKRICHLLEIIEVWTGYACIVWDTKQNKKTEVMAVADLPNYMRTYINLRERLQNLTLYKCPVFTWQYILFTFYHQFIVLQTSSGLFISIEKNSVGFVIQISEKMENVVDYIIREKRATNIFNHIKEVSYDKANGTTEDVLLWMSQRIEIERYKLKYNNCKHFATRCFGAFRSRYEAAPEQQQYEYVYALT